MHFQFTKEKLKFLADKGYTITTLLNMDVAIAIVDSLGWKDDGIASDIITKITTNEDW